MRLNKQSNDVYQDRQIVPGKIGIDLPRPSYCTLHSVILDPAYTLDYGRHDQSNYCNLLIQSIIWKKVTLLCLSLSLWTVSGPLVCPVR